MDEKLAKDLPEDFGDHPDCVDAAIQAVLVMEDRAQITRRVQVELLAGHNVLNIGSVTPLAADRSLRCRVSKIDSDQQRAARILDVRLTRRYVTKAARPEKEKELNASIDCMVDELVALSDRLRMEEYRVNMLSQALNAQARYMADCQQVGDFEPQWPAQIEEVFDQQNQGDQRRINLQKELLEKEERLRRLEEERREVIGLIAEYTATVTTEIQAQAQGIYAIEWEYQVPCALWRPEYTAELIQKPETFELNWLSRGTVWQTTLEDWKDVQLSFSTARPTLGAELPLLEDENLSVRPKSDLEKKVVEISSRDQAIEKTTDAPIKESDTPPGLEDGGQARTFQVHTKVCVPTDGRPHCFEIDSFQDESKCEYVCHGENAGFVFLRSMQTNQGKQPLLAGPVTLIKDGSFVGRSQIGYVASKERFALSWGSEDGLVVLRDCQKQLRQVGLRKRKKHEFSINLYLANYSGSEKNVQVIERVPVSEMKSVGVSIAEATTTKGFDKDQNGLCSWIMTLADGQEQKLRLDYTVEMPSSMHWKS